MAAIGPPEASSREARMRMLCGTASIALKVSQSALVCEIASRTALATAENRSPRGLVGRPSLVSRAKSSCASEDAMKCS